MKIYDKHGQTILKDAVFFYLYSWHTYFCVDNRGHKTFYINNLINKLENPVTVNGIAKLILKESYKYVIDRDYIIYTIADILHANYAILPKEIIVRVKEWSISEACNMIYKLFDSPDRAVNGKFRFDNTIVTHHRMYRRSTNAFCNTDYFGQGEACFICGRKFNWFYPSSYSKWSPTSLYLYEDQYSYCSRGECAEIVKFNKTNKTFNSFEDRLTDMLLCRFKNVIADQIKMVRDKA